jgi:hypothetical protein
MIHRLPIQGADAAIFDAGGMRQVYVLFQPLQDLA